MLTYLGRAYYETGRDEEARTALEKAVSLNKDDSLAYLYLGLTLLRTGERSPRTGILKTSDFRRQLFARQSAREQAIPSTSWRIDLNDFNSKKFSAGVTAQSRITCALLGHST